VKNNNFDVDFLLREAMSSAAMPDAELVQKVKCKTFREVSVMIKKSTARRSFGTAAVIAAVLLAATTAFAAWHFLKPSDVADKAGNHVLSAAFESETAVNINASATSGDYTFTLLAVVTGKDISDMPYYSNGALQNDRTYAVLAIQKVDGTFFDNQSVDYFFASPLIKGTNPAQVNAMSMGGAYSQNIVDGVLYRIVECDNVEMFADRGLYFAVCSGVFYNSDAFIRDAQTGEIKANPDSIEASAVFDLPIDKSLADPQKAEQYLKELLPSPSVDYDEGETGDSDNNSITDSQSETGKEITAPSLLEITN
jgi:hypothetical protein